MLDNTRVSRRRFLQQAMASTTAASVVLAGCGGENEGESTPQATEGTEGEPKRGGQRERGTPGGFNIDPRLNYVAGPIVGSQCYSYLWTVRTDTDEIIPVCATGIEQVDDLTYVFKINQNMRFHDTPEIRAKYPTLAGRHITAADLKYSIETFRDTTAAVLREYHLNEMDHVEAVDDYTLRLVNKRPYSWTVGPNSISGIVQGAIVAREVIEKEGDLRNTCVGSGPFIMDSFSQTEGIRVVRNPNYFVADEPFLDSQRWRIINDSETAEAAFRSRQTDTWAPPNALAFQSIKDASGIASNKLLASYEMQIGVKPEAAPWTDRRVLQALHYAIDRDALILTLEGGRSGEESSDYGLWTGCVPPEMQAYNLSQEELRELMPFKPEESRSLLSAAGYDTVDVRVTHVNIGKTPLLAEAMASQLRDSGFNLILEPSEIARFAVSLISGDFQMMAVQGLGESSPEQALGQYVQPGASGAWGGWDMKDEEIKATFEEMNRTFDAGERQEMAKKMTRLVLAKLPYLIRLYSPYDYQVRYDYVKGLHPERGGLADAFNYRTWLDR